MQQLPATALLLATCAAVKSLVHVRWVQGKRSQVPQGLRLNCREASQGARTHTQPPLMVQHCAQAAFSPCSTHTQQVAPPHSGHSNQTVMDPPLLPASSQRLQQSTNTAPALKAHPGRKTKDLSLSLVSSLSVSLVQGMLGTTQPLMESSLCNEWRSSAQTTHHPDAKGACMQDALSQQPP